MNSTALLGTTLVALSLAASAQNSNPTGQHAPQAVRPACPFVGASHAMTFTPGQVVENFMITSSDPDLRRFLVYVPSSYDPAGGPYPVVYMLHGTGQTAGIPVTKLSWDELAEARDFIAVFPEALEYDLQDGTRRTKWHTDSVANHVVEPYELPLADDVVFVRELNNTLSTHLNIDCERIYASGFSNGGAFVKTKIRVDLADIFAATSNAGGFGVQTAYPGEFFPDNGFDFRPHFEIVGNKDAKKEQACVDQGDLLPGEHLPMAVLDIIATDCMWVPLTVMAEELAMDSAAYSTIEQPYLTQFLWSSETLPGPHAREYRFLILRNLTHEYPSGQNYPVDFVPVYYDWMMQYTR
jgi:hypothetical protein